MSILAIYQHTQLQLPIKVLTHDEDILPLLEAAGVGLQVLNWPQQRSGLDIDALPALPERLGADGSMAHRCLQRWPATPAYAERFEGPVDPEQHLSAASWWLLAEGTGALCLSSEEQLLVLHCSAPLLLSLAAALPHWFVPAPGQACSVLRLARSAAHLELIASGRDIAARFQPLDL
ncbi:MAG: hypothetical protein ACK4VV_00950 [Pseudomonas sp.]